MAWSSASSARGIVTGAASRSLLTRHTRVDPANGWSRARHTSAQGPPSTGREPCRSYKRTSAQYQWRGNRTRSAYKSRDCRHTRAEAAVLKGRAKTYHRHEAPGGLCRVVRGAIHVAGKPHTVGTQGSIHRHTRADTVVTQGPGDTVGTQEGTRWEGCPDGWHGALHRVHEALPREQLSEAC